MTNYLILPYGYSNQQLRIEVDYLIENAKNYILDSDGELTLNEHDYNDTNYDNVAKLYAEFFNYLGTHGSGLAPVNLNLEYSHTEYTTGQVNNYLFYFKSDYKGFDSYTDDNMDVLKELLNMTKQEIDKEFVEWFNKYGIREIHSLIWDFNNQLNIELIDTTNDGFSDLFTYHIKQGDFDEKFTTDIDLSEEILANSLILIKVSDFCKQFNCDKDEVSDLLAQYEMGIINNGQYFFICEGTDAHILYVKN